MENREQEIGTYRPHTGRKNLSNTAQKQEPEVRRTQPKAEPKVEKNIERKPIKGSFFKRPAEQERPQSFDRERPKSFGDKPRYDRQEGDRTRTNNSRPWEKNDDRPRYGNKSFGDNGARTNKPKPWEKDEDRKSSYQGGYKGRPYEKSSDRGERPKSFSDKPRYGKPDGDRPRTGNTRPWEKNDDRPRYGNKSFGDNSARTNKPKPWERDDDKKSSYQGGYKARPYEKKYEPKTGRSFSSSYPKPQKARRTNLSAPADSIRLNKFIANSGICSRREADEYITNGEITVNGEVVTTLGTRIVAADVVKFHDQKLSGEKKVYLLLNKPKGYVTTMDDPHAKRTVMELVSNACPERIYPVGRLDKNTTGVLLFTNDGELTKQLTHPSYSKRKVYHVFLDKNVSKTDVERLVSGIELEDGVAIADEANYVDEKEDRTQIGLEIHSGKNRVVRRMFEALGYEVKRLDRVYFAGLTKKSLERGKWRILKPKEINILKMGSYE